ncbi:MAG: phosphate ABC transporter permease subunit PstC [Candidatus Nitrosocaldus sp.]|nr:phosphate ABC transporter permease subunit PstC [Candidatus Nitrosocaldus sp.]MDW8000696.1 phosphate ABC transporter permease subunit PstC [Candidatus Nitrosocaldus sp.]
MANRADDVHGRKGDQQPLFSRKSNNLTDIIVKYILLSASLFTIIAIIIIIYSLTSESFHFFLNIPAQEFLFGTRWAAFFDDKSFGVLPLLAGTMLTTVIALSLAIPAGIGSALFLSEYASPSLRRIVKPILELLAGIPTVVYGYFALYFITPNLQYFIPDLYTYNALAAGMAMGVMIIPTIASLSEDAFYAVPQNLKAAGYALGARKSTVIMRIVIPYTLSAIAAIIILAMGRAVGETMIVTIAAGLKPTLTLNPFESVMTMTSAIAQAATGDAPRGTIEYTSLFAIALYLFAMVAVLNLVSSYIKKRWEIRV